MELPAYLQTAIENELSQVPVNKLAALAAELSKSYRAGIKDDGRKHLRTQEDVIAYAAFRFPATFAAVHEVISHVMERLTDWRPETFLDVGAGPGTAMLAASTLWEDLKHITLLERDAHMIGLGKRIAACSPAAAVQKAEWLQVDIAGPWEVPPHDVVIASYVLNELPGNAGETFIDRLWESTKGVLIIIEPGTPAGFSQIIRARKQLLDKGAKTVGPCPHDRPCPVEGNDWCHFSRRLPRTSLHRKVKAGELSYEDEKFSFICMSRTGGKAIEGLVTRHPRIRKGHIRLELCTPEGLKGTVVTKKERDKYKRARKLRWGSIISSGDSE